MKKIIIFLLVVIPFKANAISAHSYIAMDLDNGRVLYEKNAHDKELIASITKIMTAIITIENTDNLDKEVEVSDIINNAYGSAIYLEIGEHITIRDLLYGLILRSGNDAALVLSEVVSGSKEEFVYLMNEYAKNIKMNDTVFYNPHGLENDDGKGNISSAVDMAKLTKYAMDNSIFRTIFNTKKYTSKTDKKTYVWHNKNKLLSLDYITGGKTGYTKLAKRTLVSTGSKDNMNIVVVTLNDKDDWQDHKSLYNKVFNNYKSYLIIDKNNIKIDKENYYKDYKLYVKNNYYMTLNNKEIKRIIVNYNIMKLDEFSDDTCIGYAEIMLDNNIYHKEPIYIKVSNVEEKSWLDKLKEWIRW